MSSKERKLGISLGGKLGRKKLKEQDNRENQYSPDTEMPGGAEFGGTTAEQKMTKSTSLGSINNSQDSDGMIVDQDDILTLTQDVKSFSDGLAHLKTVFSECTESAEDLRVMSHSRLGEVLCTLKNILHRYPALQSTELFAASGALIAKIKSHDYGETSNPAAEQSFCEAIDQLALAFSSSVSEYLMGDLGNSFQEKEEKKDRTKSYDNLLTVAKAKSKVKNPEQAQDGEVVHLTPEEIDSILFRLQAGVDLALQRAKAWSKYMKDITSYIERKAQLESEYSKNVMRLAQGVRPVLTEEGFLPLQSVYCTVLSQDTEYARTCQATQTLLQTSKFVEPLTNRRAEHDKMRKVIKDTWMKEMKRMQDAVHSLRKAQAMYVQRQQDYEKAKEQADKIESDMLGQSSSSALNKVDKRKKMEEDAMHKAAEAETTYKACVAEANSRQQELDKTKSEMLAKMREQILMCDQVIKSVTIDYFHLLQTVTAPVPVQYHTLYETSKQYEEGIQYGEFVRRLSMTTTNAPANSDPFIFEPYTFTHVREADNRKTSTQSTGSSSDVHSQNNSPTPPHKKDRYRVKAWGQGLTVGSDTDSASGSSKSVESSPSNSPHPTGRRNLIKTNSLDGLEEADGGMTTGGLLQLPSEGMDFQGLLKRHGRRRNTTFGVDFQEQVEHCRSAVPPIITKCLKEVERRGIFLKGIYRVSGVKSKVEGLCSKFEKDPDSVFLEDEHPNVISNVLKLYLRQLPEPLMTFKLYHNFIQIAKENMAGSLSADETVNKLGDLASKLPYSNFKTCAMLMHHLNRVASHSDENQMTASNLGIVFGPTLLRPLEGTGSLASLVDTPHQTRTVELLIVNVKNIFGPETEHELIPGETPIEQLSEDVVSKAKVEGDKSASEKTSISKEPERKDKLQKQSTSSSGSSSADRPGEQLLQTTEGDKSAPKASDADFLLPGSALTDKKESSQSPTVTISEGEDGADIDLHSDDDLPDALLPDDSNPSQHANQTDVQTLKVGKPVIDPRFYGLSPIKEEFQRVTISGVASGKPCPPQQLYLSSGKSSPGSSKKMLVPKITVIESSPVTESQPQMCYPLKASDKPRFSKAHALQNLKAIGPSLQSFVIATAKGLKANFPSSSKNSDSAKEKKSKSSPPLLRDPSTEKQSSFALQKSPKLSHQFSVSETSTVPMSPPLMAKRLAKHSSLPSDILEPALESLQDFSSILQQPTPSTNRSVSPQAKKTLILEEASKGPEDGSVNKPLASSPRPNNKEVVTDKTSQPLKISSIPSNNEENSSSLLMSSQNLTQSSITSDNVNISKPLPPLSEFKVQSQISPVSRQVTKEKTSSSPLLSRKSPVNTSPNKSPSILRQSGSYPSVTSMQYSLDFSPAFTRSSKVSFSLPEDSLSEPESSLDSSCTSSMSSPSLSSPWSSPTIPRPTLYRQNSVQSDPSSPPSVTKTFTPIPAAKSENEEQESNETGDRSDGSASPIVPNSTTATSADYPSSSTTQVNSLSTSVTSMSSTESSTTQVNSLSTSVTSMSSTESSTSTLVPPFKSSISSSSLLLSSLSPVLPRSYSGHMRPVPSIHSAIIAGNLPSGPNKPLTPLVSLPKNMAQSQDLKLASESSSPQSRYASAPDLRHFSASYTPAIPSVKEMRKSDEIPDQDTMTTDHDTMATDSPHQLIPSTFQDEPIAESVAESNSDSEIQAWPSVENELEGIDLKIVEPSDLQIVEPSDLNINEPSDMKVDEYSDQTKTVSILSDLDTIDSGMGASDHNKTEEAKSDKNELDQNKTDSARNEPDQNKSATNESDQNKGDDVKSNSVDQSKTDNDLKLDQDKADSISHEGNPAHSGEEVSVQDSEPMPSSLPASDKPTSSTIAITKAPSTVRSKGTRTTPQTSKSTVNLDPGRMAKGPSGIVMGKAAIMPGRGGAHRGGISTGTRKPNNITTVPSTKGNGRGQGSTTSTSVISDSVTSSPRKPSGTGVSTSSAAKRKPQTPTTQGNGVSCATCGRRRSSAKEAQTAKLAHSQSARKSSGDQLHERDARISCDRKGSAESVQSGEAEGTKGSNNKFQVRRGSTGGVRSRGDKVITEDTSQSLDNLQTIGESSGVTDPVCDDSGSRDIRGSDECSGGRSEQVKDSGQTETKAPVKQKLSGQAKKPSPSRRSQGSTGQEVKHSQGQRKFHDQSHGSKPTTTKSGVMKDRTPRFV